MGARTSLSKREQEQEEEEEDVLPMLRSMGAGGMLQCRNDDVVVYTLRTRERMSYSALAGAWD